MAREGRIAAIEGSVDDLTFPDDAPMMQTILLAGPKCETVIEVASLVKPETVRGLVLNPTTGLSLGMRPPVPETLHRSGP